MADLWGKRFVDLCLVLPLQSVLPLCISFTVFRVFAKGRRQPSTFVLWLLARAARHIGRSWISLELWFAAWYFFRRRRLQAKPLPPLPPATAEQRLELGLRCLSSIEQIDFDEEESTPSGLMSRSSNSDAALAASTFEGCARRLRASKSEISLENVIRLWDGEPSRTRLSASVQKLALKRASVSGWFLGASVDAIKRGNLEQWCAWAFFRKRRNELTDSERDETVALVQRVVDWAELGNICDGFEPSVSCIRLEFDPIRASYRPLAYYAVTAGLVSLTTDVVMMRVYGFQKYTSGCLTYWHRKPSGSSGLAAAQLDSPVVFCHGLGIGVLSYVFLVHDLVRAAPGQELFMVELPHISMRPVETQASPCELVASIRGLLESHGCLPGGAHFVGHSFGSIVLTWVAREDPQLACRFTFLDPVCFLLCKHDVAFNFIYKKSTNAIEALMQWFVGRELYIAYTLSRRFWWQTNILWPEQLKVPSSIVLSSEDHIVPSHAVRRHLTWWRRELQRNGGPPLKVIWLEGLGHAGFLLDSNAQREIVQLICSPN